MPRGRIVDFNDERGFGHIEHNGKRIFFHKSAIIKGDFPISVGAEAEFQERHGDRGPKAVNVRVLTPPYCGETFDTFLNEDGKIKHEIYFEAAKKTAEAWKNADLKPTQLRRLFDGFRNLVVSPLRAGRIDIEEAKTRFGKFYTERVVLPNKKKINNKKIVPDPVLHFFSAHLDLALSGNKGEVFALFEYLKSIYCYYPDK